MANRFSAFVRYWPHEDGLDCFRLFSVLRRLGFDKREAFRLARGL